MSVSGVFSAGRPTAHPNVRSILKYLPRPRVPWQPSQFNRENMLPQDLYKFWGQGRYRSGYMNFNSGYYAGKTHTMHEKTYNIIPKAQLQKFMPDISLGSKALVTPVSLMNARAGHRVTHDLLHSYDKYIGRVQTDAVVDHDNINPYDPNHVGLNAATVGSSSRIYRWLRRGPFFQQNHYFRRSLQISKETGVVPTSPHEGPLMRKIIRLAHKGHLKAAAEQYRRITSIPPVAVYRALTAACIPHARLADAIAIFEDGHSKLFYVSRDGEVLCNVMRCAIAARHRRRIMWIYNILRGRFYENVLVRAQIEPIWQYRIIALALEYLLDINAAQQSRTLYDYLVQSKMIDFDVHLRIGQLMQQALKAGKTIEMNANIFNGVGLVKNAKLVAPQVAMTLYSRYCHHTSLSCDDNNNNNVHKASAYTSTSSLQWNALRPMCSPMQMMQRQAKQVNDNVSNNTQVQSDSKTRPQEQTVLTSDAALAWMHMYFTDVNVEAIMRLARFKQGKIDLMAKRRSVYLNRAARWIELLSETHRVRQQVPLPYLIKSRPSLTNEKVRVAYMPLSQSNYNNSNNNRYALTSNACSASLLAHTEGYTFYYTPSMRMVSETFQYAGQTLQARYLAQIPHHREIPVAASFHQLSDVTYYEDGLQPSKVQNLLPSTSPSPLTLSSQSLSSLPSYSSSSILLSNPPHVVHDSVMDEVFKSTRTAFGSNANSNNTILEKNDRSAGSETGGSSESLVSSASSASTQASSDSPEF